MESEIQFKELTLRITEASTAWDVRLETQGKADVAIRVQRSSANKILSHLGKIYLFFYSGLQLTGWGPSAHRVFPGGSDCKESACNAGNPGSIPGSGRFPGERKGNPLQYYCLENSTDRGAWWATVHGVAKSQTQPSC